MSLTTEIWWDAGTSPFPFQPTSGVIDWGLAATDSVAQVADAIAWLGVHKDGGISVVSATGLQASVISTPGLEARWRSYRTIVDASAFSYRIDGNDCYVITFGAGNETFVYDFITQLWHERSSYDTQAWRANHGARFIDKQIVGDREVGNIYTMSPDLYTENGDFLVKTRRTPHIWNERKRFTVSALKIEMETGVIQGPLEPSIQLRWSKDGGHVWSNWVTRPLGKIGEYSSDAVWRQIGLAPTGDIMFDVQTSSDVKTVMIGASLEATPGTS